MSADTGWPMGLCRDIAMFSDEAVLQLEASFVFDADDFDPFFFAMFEVPHGPFILRRRLHQPADGFVLIAMENETPAIEQLNAFLEHFSLDASGVIWRSPDAHH